MFCTQLVLGEGYSAAGHRTISTHQARSSAKLLYYSSHPERCCRFTALNWAPAVNRQPFLPPGDS
eukprot:1032558-Pyramimonas_sp.AAC.1